MRSAVGLDRLQNENPSASVKDDSQENSVWRVQVDSGNSAFLAKPTPPGKPCSARLANGNRLF